MSFAWKTPNRFAFSYENREKLCAEMHSVERFFRKKANDSFVKQQARLLTYLTSDAKKKIRAFAL